MAAHAKTTPERILWNGREASQACSISERQLWAQTQPRGPIPCVRIGSSVRYSPEALQAFIAQQQRQQESAITDECMHPPGRTCNRCLPSAIRFLAQDISDLGGGPEDGGNHPQDCNCDACDPS